MESPEMFYIYIGSAISVSIYFCTLVTAVLMLLTRLWKNAPYKPNKVQKVAGYCTLLILADLVLWIYALAFKGITLSTHMAKFCEGFDVLTFASCMLIGEAICKPKSMSFKTALHFLWPFIVMQIACVIFPNSLLVHIYTAAGLCFMVVMLVRQRKMIRRYNDNLVLFYSDVESRRRNWYYRIMTILIFMELAYLTTGFLCSAYKVDLTLRAWIFIVYDLGGALIVSVIANYLLHIKEEDEETVEDIGPVNLEDNKEIPDWAAELDRLMVEDKPYLEPGLSLAGLARLVGTNRTYLSEYLNKVKAITFYDYVNGFRLEHAEQLLKNGAHTINEVAQDSGFTDIRVFRNLFKAKYGCLPSKYVK